MIEFINLRQDNMNVLDCEAKLAELFRYAPNWATTDEEKAERFQRGLSPYIQDGIAPLVIVKYEDAIGRALIIENSTGKTIKNVKCRIRDGLNRRAIKGGPQQKDFKKRKQAAPNQQHTPDDD